MSRDVVATSHVLLLRTFDCLSRDLALFCFRTRNQSKEERLITEFFSAPKEKWVEVAYEVEGPLFVAAMLPFFYGSSKWKQDRFVALLIVTLAMKMTMT